MPRPRVAPRSPTPGQRRTGAAAPAHRPRARSARQRREVFKALKPHHVDDCPFVDLPNPKSSRWGGGVTADEMREMQWVKPELVAQIRFVEWTAEGRLRHAAFLGLRSDKSAREVRREWLGLSGG